MIGGNWDAWLCSTTTCRPTCDAYVSRLTYYIYWSTYRLLSNHNIATTLLAKQTKADENTNSVVDVTAAVTTTHHRQLRYVPVKCELMNRNEDPKMWKHTATAPFVLIPEGPGRVVTVASSTTDIHNMSCTAVSNKTFPFMDLTLLVQRQVRHLSLSLFLSLRFNGHSPGEPGLASVYWSKGWWKWWWQLELWVVRSFSQIITSNKPAPSLFYRPDALPVTQPTVSKSGP